MKPLVCLLLSMAISVGTVCIAKGQDEADRLRREEFGRLGGYVEGNPNATGVLLYGKHAERKHYEMLAKFVFIKDLTLKKAVIDKQSFEALGQLKELRVIDIVNCELPCNCFDVISKLKNLHTLRVQNSKMSVESFASIENCNSLRCLEMHTVTLPESGLKSIAKLPQLEVIQVHSDTRFSKSQVDMLKASLPKAKVEVSDDVSPMPECCP